MRATLDITEGLSTAELGELADAAREAGRSLGSLLLEGARNVITIRRQKSAMVVPPMPQGPPPTSQAIPHAA